MSYKADGTVQIMRDASWEDDVRWHVVHAMAEREKHSLPTNLFTWLFCALIACALPYTQAFVLPLAMRLVAIAMARTATHSLRRKLEAHEPYEKALRHAAFTLAIAGASWGFLLWPIMHTPQIHPPAKAIVAITIVVVSLVTTTTGTLPKILFGFLAPFIGMVVLGMALAPHDVPLPDAIWRLVSLSGIIAGMIAYSLGTAREQISRAEMLVENRRLSEELISALSHAEFLSQRDPLTGLLNRRVFFEQGLLVMENSLPYHLLAIDLDHFKQINDHFGHDTGDRVLIATADAMREITHGLPGGPHSAVRMGGEEFVMILSGLDRVTAKAAAEAIRNRIARIVAELDVPGLHTSASIGMTEFRHDEALEEALTRADLAMYRAKQNGRNRVMMAA